MVPLLGMEYRFHQTYETIQIAHTLLYQVTATCRGSCPFSVLFLMLWRESIACLTMPSISFITISAPPPAPEPHFCSLQVPMGRYPEERLAQYQRAELLGRVRGDMGQQGLSKAGCHSPCGLLLGELDARHTAHAPHHHVQAAAAGQQPHGTAHGGALQTQPVHLRDLVPHTQASPLYTGAGKGSRQSGLHKFVDTRLCPLTHSAGVDSTSHGFLSSAAQLLLPTEEGAHPKPCSP